MTFLVTVLAFGCIVGAMAVGVMLGKSPLKGSCGGKGGPECVCDDFERRKCEAFNKMLASRSR
jgi:hypothetical protein